MSLSNTIKSLSKQASTDKTVYITPQGGSTKNISFSISSQIDLRPGTPGLEVIKLINSMKVDVDETVNTVLQSPNVLSKGYVSLFGKGSGITLNYSFLIEDSAARYSLEEEKYLLLNLKSKFTSNGWRVK